jgi:hypothetical protein
MFKAYLIGGVVFPCLYHILFQVLRNSEAFQNNTKSLKTSKIAPPTKTYYKTIVYQPVSRIL